MQNRIVHVHTRVVKPSTAKFIAHLRGTTNRGPSTSSFPISIHLLTIFITELKWGAVPWNKIEFTKSCSPSAETCGVRRGVRYGSFTEHSGINLIFTRVCVCFVYTV